jgi:dienelactone hydrolase
VWKDASPAAFVGPRVPPMLLLYADGDDEWRRQQQADFLKALKEGGNRDVDLQMIRGRTHNTVWSEMAKGDEDTSRAILQFVNRLARATSR